MVPKHVFINAFKSMMAFLKVTNIKYLQRNVKGWGGTESISERTSRMNQDQYNWKKQSVEGIVNRLLL